jgi:hypothetical protein
MSTGDWWTLTAVVGFAIIAVLIETMGLRDLREEMRYEKKIRNNDYTYILGRLGPIENRLLELEGAEVRNLHSENLRRTVDNMALTPRCPEVPEYRYGNFRCDLLAGHAGPHQSHSGGATAQWPVPPQTCDETVRVHTMGGTATAFCTEERAHTGPHQGKLLTGQIVTWTVLS